MTEDNLAITQEQLIASWQKLEFSPDPNAQQAYADFLQYRFDQIRAKQIADIKQLELLDSQSQLPLKNLEYWQLATFISSLACVLTFVVCILLYNKLKHKTLQLLAVEKAPPDHRSEHEVPSPTVNNNSDHNATLLRIALFENKKLKETLNQLLNKKQQKTTKDTTNHQLILAYTTLGFTLDSKPSIKKIKHRYRQLSKIYHPDASSGSVEDMTRLNLALDTIMQDQK